MLEIAIERENITGVEFIGHLDEAGVGKAGREISVFLKKSPDLSRRAGQLESDFQRPVFDGCQNICCSSVNMAQHIEAL